MSIYLSGNRELEKSLDELLDELSNYFRVVTKRKVSKVELVTLALYMLMRSDEIYSMVGELPDMTDHEKIGGTIQYFRYKTKPIKEDIIDTIVREHEVSEKEEVTECQTQ